MSDIADKNYTDVRGNDVVISGISGRFPECNNMHEYQENLLNKKDLITDDGRRWKLDHLEVPQRTGKLNGIEKFDADYFNITIDEAEGMDPGSRMIMERTYEALIDAGVNPIHLRNTKTAVIIATSFSESEANLIYEDTKLHGQGLPGCSRAMSANRISSWLNVTGPSFSIDTACSSSFYAIEYAYRAIKNGHCDAAIVGGMNLCLHPYISLQFSRLGLLSPEGKCKTFDDTANGYTRSETIAVTFLQRAKDAKRIYATLVHAKTNCDGFKKHGITFPSSEIQACLLREFYEECGVPTTCVSYMEAHGTGTKVGDPEEVNAIDKILCAGRSTPLKIGSIKSNLGHAEAASGMCAVGKIIIAMETGLIPPNLHYKTPKRTIDALVKGRIQVITDPTPWERDYAAANSFGFGGANGHILLKSNPKKVVNNGHSKDDLPRLVCVSGRTAEAVRSLLDELESRPVNAEHVSLLHDIHADNIPGHLYRGYTIVGPEGAYCPLVNKKIQKGNSAKNQIWYVFSGIGCQWLGMGIDLLRFPVFAKTIKTCDALLKPLGVNIYEILTTKKDVIFNNAVNSFVGIIAVQIGLVDLLSLVDILPDKIIGYGIGELACAYASGCLDIEQTVLAAYYSASAINESKVIRGSMAIVVLGYNNLKNICPPNVEIVCQNGEFSSVISGPAEIVKPFLVNLQSKNILVHELSSSDIPLHSRYMAVAEQKLLSSLKTVITDPKPRHSKWLSTTIPLAEWSTSKAHLFSAEYYSYNLLRPVLLEQTLAMIPKDAVVIEVSPDGILQSVLRKSIPHITNTTISICGREDNVEVVLNCLGKLYTRGFQPQIQKLYPKVSYPVSRGTPQIAPYIKWDHSKDWYVISCKYGVSFSGERIIYVTTRDEAFEYMKGHIIDGRNLLPATGYLDLVWQTFGMERGQLLYTVISVVFENVKFLRATTVSNDNTITLAVTIQKGTGMFEIVEGGAAVCTGKMYATSNPSNEKFEVSEENTNDEPEIMMTKDVYKEFRLRGYNYSGLFCSIESASVSGTKGHILWKNNWAAFMDNMLQMKILGIDTRELLIPTEINKIVIDVKKHLADIQSLPTEEKILPVRVDNELDTIESGGIRIRGLTASMIARKRPTYKPVLEQYKFVPYIDRTETSLSQALQIAMHIALENCSSSKIKTLELVSENDTVTHESLASPLISEILENLPLVEANITVISPIEMFKRNAIPENISLSPPNAFLTDKNILLAIGYNLLHQKDNLKSLRLLLASVQDNGFILSRENTDNIELTPILSSQQLSLISQRKVGKEHLILLRKKVKLPRKTITVHIKNENFTWLPKLQDIMQKEMQGRSFRIYLVSEKNVESGLLGFANCLRRESGGSAIRVVLIQDLKALEFSLKSPFYAEQLELDLAFNVLRPGNIWGSYRHLPTPPLIPQPVYHAMINQTTRGNMDSLRWFEGPIVENVKNSKLTYIYYASINFKDIMLASGKLGVNTQRSSRREQENFIGFEYSGVNAAGRRVMGLVNYAALSNCCVPDTDLSWEVPDHWTLEDAATVPCVYATCYYALYYIAKMIKGNKILIHAGSGGVGQAAINLALYEGCEIFTTVGTPEKRRFIREHFPQIPDDHIGNSRDTSFEQMVLQHTEGKGVDIVLNSLAEEKLQASVRCLANNGQFLEIGKFDIAANNTLDLEVFTKGISFYGVMLDAIFDANLEFKKTLQCLLADCIKSGAVKPLVRSVFPKDQVKEAFRFMAAGKHIGKVIIKIREEKEPLKTSMIALPRYYCYRDRSYIIFGGLGGFGLELADWLILRGAQYLILISRNGVSNGYQRQRISVWRNYGVTIDIMAVEDAWKRENCEAILKKASSLAPVDGIFNLAVVLSDNLFENQTTETFENSFKSKVGITKQLDELSRKLCPELRHFVVFSSVSCGRGNIGQTNYGMANSIMERICEKRISEGLHGLAVQWGAVGDVGLVADMQEFHKEVVIGGTLQQSIFSCLQVLDDFLRQSNIPVVSSMVVAEKRAGTGINDIVGTVLNVLGIKDIKSINPQVSLTELGMDSMAAVEIKQTLEREFEIFLSPQEIRSLNFEKLKELDKTSDNKENGSVKKVEEKRRVALEAFVDITSKNYLHPTRICSELPTQNQSAGNEMFIVPGIEGFGDSLKPLVPKIRNPVTCLELGVKHENLEDIEKITNEFWHAIVGRCKGRKDFTLIGYSFGSLIAIELARKFESEEFKGRIILIDGSPKTLKTITECILPSMSISETETMILVHFMDKIAPEISAQLVEIMVDCVTWNEKLNTFLQLVPLISDTLSLEGLGSFCTAVYKRIMAILDYSEKEKVLIKSPITLIKPTTPIINSSSEDYGLHEVTEGKVEIYTVEGDHKTILESDKVAAIINGDTLAEKDSK